MRQINEAFKKWWIQLATLIAASAVALAIVVAKPACDESLQQQVDAAAPGAIVQTPGDCIYREAVIIDKPLTLKAGVGAEIRGSDVWTNWTKNGSYWVRGTIPRFGTHGECRLGVSRCLWAEQVFFDGKPLLQVTSNPASGQFSVNGNREIVLADKPVGHTVEVTTRRHWVVGKAENVTVEGFTMKHAANDSQSGALMNRLRASDRGYSHWTVKDAVLSDAHGATVSLANATDLNIIRNDIHHGGQLGIHAHNAELSVQGNRIHHNNTEEFNPEWEAGGIKVTVGKTLRVKENEVYSNAGKGLWCDMGCTDAIYSNNRIHHNEHMGINFEISAGAKIFDNVVWENGYGKPGWGWGAGILSSSSSDVEIYDNVLAWNADGISIISANRRDCGACAVSNVNVHDNSVLAKDGPNNIANPTLGLAWMQDWQGLMFDPASHNRGANNRYWYPGSEGRFVRFAWEEPFTKLSDFNETPGESDGRYLTNPQKNKIVSSLELPQFSSNTN